jgi:uncharacterized protein
MVWLVLGCVSTALGIIGIALPIMPTVPFLIFAAFCFARSSPALEQRIMDHAIYGPPIRNWHEKGIITRKGKLASTFAFACSLVFGWFTLSGWWLALPPVIAVTCLSWIWTRPEV